MYNQLFYNEGGKLFQYLKQKELVDETESYSLKSQTMDELNFIDPQQQQTTKDKNSYQMYYEQQPFFWILNLLFGPQLLFHYYSTHKIQKISKLNLSLLVIIILFTILIIYCAWIFKIYILMILFGILVFFNQLSGTDLLLICEKIELIDNILIINYKNLLKFMNEHRFSDPQRIQLIQNELRMYLKKLNQRIQAILKKKNNCIKQEIQSSLNEQETSNRIQQTKQEQVKYYFKLLEESKKELSKQSLKFFISPIQKLLEKFLLKLELKDFIKFQKKVSDELQLMLLLQQRINNIRYKSIFKKGNSQDKRQTPVNMKLDNIKSCLERLKLIKNILINYAQYIQKQQQGKHQKLIQECLNEVTGIFKYLNQILKDSKQIKVNDQLFKQTGNKIYQFQQQNQLITNKNKNNQNAFMCYYDDGKQIEYQGNTQINQITNKLQHLFSSKGGIKINKQKLQTKPENIPIKFNFLSQLKSKIQFSVQKDD